MSSDSNDANTPDSAFEAMAPFTSFFDMQGEAMRNMFANALPAAMPPVGMPSGAMSGAGSEGNPLSAMLSKDMNASDLGEWAKAGGELQQMWLQFVAEQAASAAGKAT